MVLGWLEGGSMIVFRVGLKVVLRWSSIWDLSLFIQTSTS